MQKRHEFKGTRGGMLWNECLYLPQIHILKPYLKCDDIRKWGSGGQFHLDEAMKLSPDDGINVFIERD